MAKNETSCMLKIGMMVFHEIARGDLFLLCVKDRAKAAIRLTPVMIMRGDSRQRSYLGLRNRSLHLGARLVRDHIVRFGFRDRLSK